MTDFLNNRNNTKKCDSPTGGRQCDIPAFKLDQSRGKKLTRTGKILKHGFRKYFEEQIENAVMEDLHNNSKQ